MIEINVHNILPEIEIVLDYYSNGKKIVKIVSYLYCICFVFVLAKNDSSIDIGHLV